MPKMLMETNNYGIFELLEFNRNVEKTSALEMSMKRHGYIPAYPLHVVRSNNGKLRIKAGHHRFEVARKLGLHVYYIVCHDSATVFELEKATRKWTMRDYLESHIREGKNPAYCRVKEYLSETGVDLSSALSMLAGESAGNGNYLKSFKEGTYRLGDPSHSLKVKEIVLHCVKCEIPWARHTLFVQAISKILWVEEIDISRLKRRISNHHHHMKKCPSKQEYIQMLEGIYNRQCQDKDKIPLAYLAQQQANKRNLALNPMGEKFRGQINRKVPLGSSEHSCFCQPPAAP